MARFLLFHRKLVQLFTALIYNANLSGFLKGSIFKGATKGVCVPGLNCYSCPGAIGSCPLGSLQSSFSSLPNRFPFYILGTLLLFGALLGRTVCGFLCPFGLIQELLYKIPSGKIKKGNWSRHLSKLKYAVLAIFVLLIPLVTLVRSGVAVPAFCKYICPAGTLEAGVPLLIANEGLRGALGLLFGWKALVLLAVLLASVFIFRPFCRFLCPLGLIYGLFNRIAPIGITLDESACTSCGNCQRACKMDVKRVNSMECIRCGECIPSCPHGAICLNRKPIKKEPAHEKS